MIEYLQLSDRLLISPVAHAPFFVDALFRKKFGDPAPEYGHAVVCFYRHDWHQFMPLCYTSFLPYEEVILVGGAMTDGAVFRLMSEETRAAIKAQGGAYFQVLKFAFDYYRDDCEAFFGHAGDKRAYEIDLRAGFVPTPHEHLIVNFHKPLTLSRKDALIAKIHALGPF